MPQQHGNDSLLKRWRLKERSPIQVRVNVFRGKKKKKKTVNPVFASETEF